MGLFVEKPESQGELLEPNLGAAGEPVEDFKQKKDTRHSCVLGKIPLTTAGTLDGKGALVARRPQWKLLQNFESEKQGPGLGLSGKPGRRLRTDDLDTTLTVNTI